MADRYWVGGTGNWSDNTNHWSDSSGGSPGATLPTSSDNVIFDANSGTGTVTINTTANCLDFDASASTVTTFAGSSSLNVYGSFTLGTGLTMSYSGTITFRATSTGKTLTFGGNSLKCSLTFDGTGGGWTFQDNLTYGANAKSLTLTGGSLDINGKTVTTSESYFNLSSSNTSTRTLTLGTATLSKCEVSLSSTNLTFSGSSSTISSSDVYGFFNFRGGGQTFGTVTLYPSYQYSPSAITGDNTFTTLTIIGDSTRGGGVGIVGNQTVSGTFTASTSTYRLNLFSDSLTRRTISAGTVSCSNVNFFNIEGAGAGSWNLSSNNCGDMGLNSGITFPTPVTRYWVATSGGDWVNTTSWSDSSGGSSGFSVPLPHDTVVFDANSITSSGRTISSSKVFAVPSLDFSNVLNSPTVSLIATTIVTGSLNTAGLTTFGTTVHFYCDSNISFNPINYGYGFQFMVVNGTVTFTDDFNGGTTRSIIIGYATIDFNDNDITCSGITELSNATGTVYFGNGTITVGGFYNIISLIGTTVYAENSTISITSGSSLWKIIAVADPLNIVTISSDNVTFLYGTTIAELNLNTAGLTTGTIFTKSTTSNISNFSTNGSSGNLVKIRSSSTTNATLNYTGTGVVEEDYIDIDYITGTPDNTWYVGANSTDGGHNSKIYFTDAPEESSSLVEVASDEISLTSLTTSTTGEALSQPSSDEVNLTIASSHTTGEALSQPSSDEILITSLSPSLIAGRVFGVNSDEVSLISPSVLAKVYVSAQVNSDEVSLTNPSVLVGVSALTQVNCDEISLTSPSVDFFVSKSLTALDLSFSSPAVSVDWDYLWVRGGGLESVGWNSIEASDNTWTKGNEKNTIWEKQ